MPSPKKYWAFISYSSKDRKWGAWLHRRLEGFSIPSEFQGTELFDGAVLGRNLRPVFRDRDELSGSSELGPAIAEALKETRYLIVLCSKNSAKSEWVNKEIEDFKALGGERNILALILDGEPNATSNDSRPNDEECFPPSLRYPAEPLAGDLRKEGDGKERGFLKVIAGVAQLDFDQLYRRHERMQRRKRLLAGGAAVAIIAALAGLSIFAFTQQAQALKNAAEAIAQRENVARERDKQTRILHENSIKSWAAAEQSFQKGSLREALLHLASGLQSDPSNRSLVPFTVSILEDMNHLMKEVRFERPLYGLGGVLPDSLYTAEANFSESLEFVSRDPWSFKPIESVLMAQPSVQPWGEENPGQSILEKMKAPVAEHPWLKDVFWSFQQNWVGADGDAEGYKYDVFRFDEKGSAGKAGTVLRSEKEIQADYYRIPSNSARLSWMAKGASNDIPPGSARIILGDDSIESRVSEDGDLLSKLEGRVIAIKPNMSRFESAEKGISLGPFSLSANAEAVIIEGRENSYSIPPFENDEALFNYHGQEGLLVIVVARDGKIRVTILNEDGALLAGTELTAKEFNPYTTVVRFSGSKRLLLVFEETVMLWDWEKRGSTPIIKTLGSTRDEVGWLGSAAISHDEKTVAVGYKRQLFLFSTADFQEIEKAVYHNTIVSGLEFSADDRYLISTTGFSDGAGSTGYAQVWKFPELEPVGEPLELMTKNYMGRPYAQQITHLAVSGDGTFFVAGGATPEISLIRIYDLETSLPLSGYIDQPAGMVQFFFEEMVALGSAGEIGVGALTYSPEEAYSHMLPRPLGDVPPWFHEAFIPYCASLKFDDEGIIRTLAPSDFTEFYRIIEEASKTETGPYIDILKRFVPKLAEE